MTPTRDAALAGAAGGSGGEEEKEAAGLAAHAPFSAASGAVYALARTRLSPVVALPAPAAGVAFGLLVHGRRYPKADSPQAWSASAVVMMVQALLGLRPLTPLGVVAVDPHLPEWLPTLTLRNVRLGHAVGSLRFWRDGRGRTRFRADVPGVRVVRVKGLRQHRWAH